MLARLDENAAAFAEEAENLEASGFFRCGENLGTFQEILISSKYCI